MKKQKENQDRKYFDQLPEPIPLQKKCLKTPRSIFPLISLPDFSFTNEQQPLLSAQRQPLSSMQKPSLKSRSTSPKRKIPTNKNSNVFYTQQTQLNVLFQKPIYIYTKRLSKVSNKNFCNIKVFPQESQSHPFIQEQNINIKNDDLDHEQNLSFQSRFESGNLAMAAKFSENQYLLLLTKDLNTARCTQWFFFRVINKKASKFTFHILNFFKNYSSFECGMQVCVASKSKNYTWQRDGQNVEYRRTNLKTEHKLMYCLSYTYEFQSENDVTFFSYSYPYTYSRLDKMLFELEDLNQSILKRRSIGTSLGGNSVDMLTITNFKTPLINKKVVLITSRVHPGETPSSFVMEGVIKKLLQQSQQMQNARQKFVFKLVPMLNPDGVINGNYRCSLSGYDMNRIWNVCDKQKFPEIYCVKKMLQCSRKPFLFIDLHGHSKKKGAFMYGCSIKNNPFMCRQIPFLLWKSINEFNYYQCSFSTSSKNRQGTARMNVFKEFGVTLSYTMQHSFCGPLKNRTHFTVSNYQSIGENLVLALEKYYGTRNKKIQPQNDILSQLYTNKDLLKVGQDKQNDSSSDSELQQEFQVDIEEDKKSRPRLQKFRPKSKLNCQNLNDTSIKTPRQRFNNNFLLSRTSSFRDKANSEMKINAKKPMNQKLPKAGFQMQEGIIPLNNKSLSKDNLKKQDDFLSSRKLIPTLRYCEDQVNNLTNLFLPSVTSSAYKKYNKKKSVNKGIVHVGRRFLQNVGYFKDEIKSSLNKKKIEWKSSGNSFLN